MNRPDIAMFGTQLNALAEVFGKPPVSVKAMEVWFDSLKEFPTERVMDVVNGWSKRNGRFPTPAQVWDSVNATCVDAREKKAAFERAQNVGQAREYFAPTFNGRRICEEIRERLKRKPKPIRQHYEELLARENLPLAVREFAQQAYAVLVPVRAPVVDVQADLDRMKEAMANVERVPGEDDEPALGIPMDALEREFGDRMNP